MGARILVVEDNPTNLELMIYLLGALGHEPFSAVDGSDALASVRSRAPDLVICDLQLPRVDGYEVARQMKADRSLAGIPIIAVTAYAMPGDRERAFAAGFNGYISKPIVPEQFMQQIGRFLVRAGLPESDWTDPDKPGSEHFRASILVIEPQPASCRRIARALEKRGFRLLFADSVKQVKEDQLQEKADLILAGAVDAQAIVELGLAAPECVLWPVPLNPGDLIFQVESSLAERMRVT